MPPSPQPHQKRERTGRHTLSKAMSHPGKDERNAHESAETEASDKDCSFQSCAKSCHCMTAVLPIYSRVSGCVRCESAKSDTE
eukprot:5427236-Amphidinium_carterae.1